MIACCGPSNFRIRRAQAASPRPKFGRQEARGQAAAGRPTGLRAGTKPSIPAWINPARGRVLEQDGSRGGAVGSHLAVGIEHPSCIACASPCLGQPVGDVLPGLRPVFAPAAGSESPPPTSAARASVSAALRCPPAVSDSPKIGAFVAKIQPAEARAADRRAAARHGLRRFAAERSGGWRWTRAEPVLRRSGRGAAGCIQAQHRRRRAPAENQIALIATSAPAQPARSIPVRGSPPPRPATIGGRQRKGQPPQAPEPGARRHLRGSHGRGGVDAADKGHDGKLPFGIDMFRDGRADACRTVRRGYRGPWPEQDKLGPPPPTGAILP